MTTSAPGGDPPFAQIHRLFRIARHRALDERRRRLATHPHVHRRTAREPAGEV